MPQILPYASPDPQTNRDDLLYLKALAIAHDILGVLAIFGFVIGSQLTSDDRRPLILMLLGSLAILLSGISIHVRRLRYFSMIIAAGLCLMFPIGTILGVYTLRLLAREHRCPV